jgi:hypothetical protein
MHETMVSGELHDPSALPMEINPQYPQDRRMGGPRAALEDVNKKYKFCFYKKSSCDFSVTQPVA